MLGKSPPLFSLSPGDIMITNDPCLGPGQLNDTTIVSPIFHGSELVAFVGTASHLPDIGGIGYSPNSREVYEEGLTNPMTKLARAGELNEELLEIIRCNVRMEDQVIGDIKAAVSAGHMC